MSDNAINISAARVSIAFVVAATEFEKLLTDDLIPPLVQEVIRQYPDQKLTPVEQALSVLVGTWRNEWELQHPDEAAYQEKLEHMFTDHGSNLPALLYIDREEPDSDLIDATVELAYRKYVIGRMIEFLEINRMSIPAELKEFLTKEIKDFTDGDPDEGDIDEFRRLIER